MPQNFTPGTGRLALDRYDFKDHVDGTDFKHTATSIDLSTPITIDGTPYTDVYSALTALAAGGGGGGDGYSNIWVTQAITGNLTILHTDSFTRVAATLSAPITITLPAASLVTIGRYYVIQDISGNSQTHNISLIPNGSNTINGATGTQTLASNSGTWIVVCNGATSWQLIYTGFSGLTSSGLTVGNMSLTQSSINFAGASSLSATQLVVASAGVINSTQFTLGEVGVFANGAIQIGSSAASGGAIRLESGDPAGAIYGIGTGGNDARIIAIDNSAQILIGDGVFGGDILFQNEVGTNDDIVMSSNADIIFNPARERYQAVPIRPFGITSAVGSIAAISAGAEDGSIIFLPGSSTHYSHTGYNFTFRVLNTGTTAHYGVAVDLTPYLVMYYGATLSEVSVTLDPAAHGALPQTMPGIAVTRSPYGTLAIVNLKSGSFLQSDTSADTTAYNANHEITYTCDQNNIIDAQNYVYTLHIYDAGGSNATGTTDWFHASLYITNITSITKMV